MDKRYDHEQFEAWCRQKWLEEETYAQKNHPGTFFSIDTPPPTVSGSLHIGHIFSYTQTDIIARFERMNGRSVFYPFGFDDNGLPTEKYVEKKHNVRAHDLGRTSFIQLCLKESALAQQEFKELWQRIGISANWADVYSTISAPVRKIAQESFIRLYQQGYIYRTFEPALYCTTCRTSVAQAELEDIEKESSFNTISFYSTDGNPLNIATTRPELLPSCVALFYHPDDARYRHLNATTAVVPIFNYAVPLLADDHVDPEKGTGLVMCCSFGDKTDVYWIKKYALPYRQSIGLDGRWTQETDILKGLKAHEARAKIIDVLKEQGYLRDQKPIVHAVNVHERCKKEIEYVPLSQWFVSLLPYKERFLSLAEQINWYPEHMKFRFIDWVEHLSWDWCISRQRFYGIPFPAWHCQLCGAVLLPSLNDLPIDPQETSYAGGECTECGGTDIKPDTDVMDTWNTSSLTPFICYSLYNQQSVSPFDDVLIKEFMPMSMRPQAHDIIRTWAFYTLVKTAFHYQTIPWHDIVISGHVLSDAQEKLSKSKEQKKTDPHYLLKQYPADVIRYWTTAASLGHDVLFSETRLKIGNRLLTKLWNAFRFINEHTRDIMLQQANKRDNERGMVNEWIMHQASACFDAYKKHFDRYEFNLALDAVETFFWHDFCDNYLELIKHQLFNPDVYEPHEVEQTKQTLYRVGLAIIQLYAPFLPFITEAIFTAVYDNQEAKSIHVTKFAAVQLTVTFERSVSFMNVVMNIVQQVRKLKTEHHYSLKTTVPVLNVFGLTVEQIAALEQIKTLLKGVTRAQHLTLSQLDDAQSNVHKQEEEMVSMDIVVTSV